MRRIVKCLILFLGVSFIGFGQTFSQNEIVIHNAKPGMGFEGTVTNLNVGPTEPRYSINTGNILNAHFFPALLYYSKGNYNSALKDMQYFIDRPQYTKNHPQHLKYLSIAHYICGMIYLDHASGQGRYTRAKENFEKSIQLDPGNHLAYLGISHVLSEVEMKEQKPPAPAADEQQNPSRAGAVEDDGLTEGSNGVGRGSGERDAQRRPPAGTEHRSVVVGLTRQSGMQQRKGRRPLNRDVLQKLGRTLESYYDHARQQELPQHLKDLLKRLDDPRNGSPPKNEGSS